MGPDLSKEEVPIFSGWIVLDVLWEIIINGDSCLLSSEHERKMELGKASVSESAWNTTSKFEQYPVFESCSGSPLGPYLVTPIYLVFLRLCWVRDFRKTKRVFTMSQSELCSCKQLVRMSSPVSPLCFCHWTHSEQFNRSLP